jgi:hypothetical protein
MGKPQAEIMGMSESSAPAGGLRATLRVAMRVWSKRCFRFILHN